MAVHDRLKPPTLETAPARAFYGLPLTLALAVLAAGFAYAMPRLDTVSAETDDPAVVVVATPTATPSATITSGPAPTEEIETEVEEESEDSEVAGHSDNHGKVVSTAAHCPIQGKAHGELVRSIAQDKAATVADAEAACAAALEVQETAAAEPKSTGRAQATKPPKPEKPANAPKPPTTTGETTEDEGADATEGGGGKPDHAGKPAKP